MQTITREYGFDTGHRVMNERFKCFKNIIFKLLVLKVLFHTSIVWAYLYGRINMTEATINKLYYSFSTRASA